MNNEIIERARHKAFAKISFLELENKAYIREILKQVVMVE